MRDHTGDYRGFIWTSRAWYAEANGLGVDNEEINFGMYSPEGGTSGEMHIRWVEVGGDMTPRLEAFDDSWSALAQFSDLIQAMGELDSKNTTPDKFVQLLRDHGFKDMTPYEGNE